MHKTQQRAATAMRVILGLLLGALVILLVLGMALAFGS